MNKQNVLYLFPIYVVFYCGILQRYSSDCH